jgi:hypothetical protein
VARTPATVAPALTNEAANSRPLPAHRESPWVPAEVRWTTVAPSRSAAATSVGELPRSNPSRRWPPSSPASTTRPCRVATSSSRSANAAAAVSTASTPAAPRSYSHGTVVKARRTSITTTTSSGTALREVDEPDLHQAAGW